VIRVLAFVLSLALQEPRESRDKRDEFVRIEVTCTAVSGNSVYLDQGRDAGLRPGDRVRMFLPEGAPRRGKVSSVSRTSARAELDGGVKGLDIGLLGEAWIPRKRLETAEEEAKAAEDPSAPVEPEAESESEPEPEPAAHPPWTHPPEEWNQDLPLLAPAHGRAPEERPRRLDGRVFTTFDWTDDQAGDAERQTFASALGFDGRIENPFGRGGRLSFDAEAFGRRFHTAGEDEDESKLRLDRLSYAWGGVRGARDRGEVGRFLQSELPSLGFLDGVEYVHQVGSTHRFGASAGFQPVPDDLFRSGDDFQAALFYRRANDEDRSLSYALGVQKTWHQGIADRDLLATELELHPGARTSLFGSALVDWYTSGDDLKSPGPELTQLFVNATHRTAGGHGCGLFLSRFRWPQLERDEFPDVTAEEIADSVSTRYGGDAWLAVGAHTQLYGRLDSWTDEDDSGGGGRARVTWRDLLQRGDLLTLESYVNSGKFTHTLGVRASARRRFEHGAVDLSWDVTDFDQEDVDEDLLQHAVRGAFDLELGAHWTLALYAETRFGDEQDALSLGFLLQRSFD